MQEAITILREVSNNLNPHILTNYGLMDAIEAFIDKFEENELLSIVFTPIVNEKISHNVEVALYRIVIELINNTMKYASANRIYITFKKLKGSKLKMIYADDGVGFDLNKIKKSASGIGLLNIQNRVSTLDGDLEIKTSENKGFIATIVLNNY
jgi:signal transduction histidine kinase